MLPNTSMKMVLLGIAFVAGGAGAMLWMDYLLSRTRGLGK